MKQIRKILREIRRLERIDCDFYSAQWRWDRIKEYVESLNNDEKRSSSGN